MSRATASIAVVEGGCHSSAGRCTFVESSIPTEGQRRDCNRSPHYELLSIVNFGQRIKLWNTVCVRYMYVNVCMKYVVNNTILKIIITFFF